MHRTDRTERPCTLILLPSIRRVATIKVGPEYRDMLQRCACKVNSILTFTERSLSEKGETLLSLNTSAMRTAPYNNDHDDQAAALPPDRRGVQAHATVTVDLFLFSGLLT